MTPSAWSAAARMIGVGPRHRLGWPAVAWLAAALGLWGCRGTVVPPAETSLPTEAASATPSPAPAATPTATEVPLAARVNGAPISLEAYQRELGRYESAQAALGNDLGSLGNYGARVLDDLIKRELVLQGAAREGLVVADAEVQARYDAAVQAAGGQGAFDAWLRAENYTAEEFREVLRVAMTTHALAEVVVDTPDTVEQVHSRHILLGTEEEAQTVLALLQGQADFADLARRYSRDLSTRLNGGELGWFYRGALAMPEVEDVAFNLQPNEISGIVRSTVGYHIVQTLERDPARAMDPADLASIRQQAFDEWLAAERAGAAVVVLNQ